MGIPVIDFIIISENDHYSFHEKLKKQKGSFDYVADGIQGTLFALLEIEKPVYEVTTIQKIDKPYFHFSKAQNNTFQLQNRRYLGNKYKLLGFIEDIVSEKCNGIKSFCDIFAGTGVVGERFNKPEIKVISNDLLFSNYACLKAFWKYLFFIRKRQKNWRYPGRNREYCRNRGRKKHSHLFVIIRGRQSCK